MLPSPEFLRISYAVKNKFGPGIHSALRRKGSDFKKRLTEKQKVRSYWITERQFRNYIKEAFKKPGVAGEYLLSLLERRLDNMVYRLDFAPTLCSARQLVTHGHIRVNGRKVSIPSYIVSEKEEISLKEESKKLALVKEGLARSLARRNINLPETHPAGNLHLRVR